MLRTLQKRAKELKLGAKKQYEAVDKPTLVPVWYLSFWTRKISPITRKNEEESPFQMNAGAINAIRHPNSAGAVDTNVTDIDQSGNYPRLGSVRSNKLIEVTLDQCIVKITTYLYQTTEEVQPLEIVLASVFKPDCEQKAGDFSSYSLKLLRDLVQSTLRKNNVLKYTVVEFGRLWCINQNKGEFHEISKQEDFELIIQKLYISHSQENVFEFVFFPEPEDKREDRLAVDKSWVSSTLDGQFREDGSSTISTDVISKSHHTFSDMESLSSDTSQCSRSVRGDTASGKLQVQQQVGRKSSPSTIRITNPDTIVRKPLGRTIVKSESVESREARWNKLLILEKKFAYRMGGDGGDEVIKTYDAKRFDSATSSDLLTDEEFEENQESGHEMPKLTAAQVVAR